MNRKLLDFLICPACLPEEVPLGLEEKAFSGNEIIEGELHCRDCGKIYLICKGIATILPDEGTALPSAGTRYEDPTMLSAYLWSHYADLLNDSDASDAYRQWAVEFFQFGGAALDAGCATGRFTFEMAQKFDFAVGLDRSVNFIATARQILRNRKLVFKMREEGCICTEREMVLPETWSTENIEFIVGDAHALPFRSGIFAGVASLNLVDKVPAPLAHLKEASRVASVCGAQFLLSDPFSWSEEICAREQWLGGTKSGRFCGPALDNISRLLSGSEGEVHPHWKIARHGSVWWKIRNHRNHFELIRSVFIKAERPPVTEAAGDTVPVVAESSAKEIS